MLGWIPGRPGASEVVNGFEGGFFVTFVPVFAEENIVHGVLGSSPAAAALLLKVQHVKGGLHLFWNLTSRNIRPIQEFAEEAQAVGEEIARRAGLPIAA